MNLGETILELRKKANLTQDELAQKLGVSPQAVSKWEKGTSCPDISLLPEISKIFNISVDNILSGEIEDIKEENNEKEDKGEIPLQNNHSLKRIKIIVSSRYKKDTVVKLPISVVNLGLNIGGAFGALTDEMIGTIKTAIFNGISGEILNIDTENDENVRIILE